MSDKTSIEWAESTWNPLRGQNARHTCARISPGCDNCYAATMTRRGLMGTAPIDYGVGETPNDPARLDEKALLLPLSWKKPRKVFVCSMTDLFGTWVPDEWIDRIVAVMANAPQHTFIVLTKRPTNMARYFQALSGAVTLFIDRTGETPALHEMERRRVDTGARCWPLPNVWIGATIESDQYAWRADRLRHTPATVRWISAEPLLSGLPSLDLTGIDWLVSGGESGPKARPSHPDWYRDLRDRCQAAGTAYFMKQWGAHVYPSQAPEALYRELDAAHNLAGIPEQPYRVGNHKSGRLLDGRTWDQFPEPRVPAEPGARGGALP